jgi:two-component system phosphate regulon response regulator PhoB/two-component system alkaline phosphatase synthesis response regulator PhoP
MARNTGKFPVTRQTGRHRAITGSHAIVKRTLLVVDDEPDIARLVSRIFERRGYQIAVSFDGEDALARVAAAPPDLILLDLNLPKIDGWEVCRRLKSDALTRSIPIIILSAANITPDDARYGFELGADEYVIKPFVKEVLVHNVERLLGKKG